MKQESQKEIHWFERLEADIADTETSGIRISSEQWQNMRKNLVFEKHIVESYRWVHETALALRHADEPWHAYHALRGVLFALRDRMPVHEVFQLSAQLPLHIRGLFFEGYNPADKPQKFHVDELLERIARELGPKFKTESPVAFQAVLHVLYNHITEGELNDIYATLPQDIKELWDEARK